MDRKTLEQSCAGFWSQTARMKLPLRTIFLLVIAICPLSAVADPAPWIGISFTGITCEGGSAGNFGPYDYMIDKEKLPVVERRHFTPQVEQLVKGESTLDPMRDVNYTLVRFPNHHRALYSAVRFSLGEAPSSKGDYFAECYLQRAINFSPSDPVPQMLFGLYLHRLGKLDQSLKHYRVAEKLAPNDANLLYNIGLVLFDSGKFSEAYEYAKRAYDSGMDFPALKRKLQKAGYWK